MAGQAGRIAAVSSPLGGDTLVLRRLRAVEQVSRAFRFELELLSENGGIRPEQLLGQRMTVRFELPAGGTRYFDGLVSRFCWLGGEGRYARYEARVDPWLWYLTRSADCRIFQGQTVPQIVKQVFADYPMAVFEDRLTASYRSWDYCVQYRETDYAFVNRLLEQEGISYFFTHADGRHTLILADRDSVTEHISNYDRVPFYPPEDAGIRERDHVFAWAARQEVRSGAWVLRDFDFEKPRADLESRRQAPRPHALAELELYDYPGVYLSADEGEVCSRIRLEETQADQEICEGAGDVAGLIPGCVFTLTKHPRSDQNREYRVLSTAFELTNDEYESRGEPGTGFSHTCAFTAMDSQRPYRPPRSTPKPLVQGPQTAIVTGPAGEEIWCDKYGRVKVQFHWDRLGKRDENSSCWVRVSHPWAGKGWGAVAIPRIGQEVIVEFLEGDPDRPIITGRVYNADAMPPYTLPAGAVQSGVKSQTHKGEGYNEISMDDSTGTERITVHAQYDMGTTVEHDDTQTIRNNRVITVDGTHVETIRKDTRITISEGTYNHDVTAQTATYHVKGAVQESYDHTHATVVQNDRIITVNGAHTETIAKDTRIIINANRSETTKGDTEITITDGAYSHRVAANKATFFVRGDVEETYAANQTTVVANAIEIASANASIHVTAATEIVLTAGASRIILTADGKISLIGREIALTAESLVAASAETVSCTGQKEARMAVSSQVVSCTPEKVETSGSDISSSAMGVHEITGAIVKIN